MPTAGGEARMRGTALRRLEGAAVGLLRAQPAAHHLRARPADPGAAMRGPRRGRVEKAVDTFLRPCVLGFRFTTLYVVTSG